MLSSVQNNTTSLLRTEFQPLHREKIIFYGPKLDQEDKNIAAARHKHCAQLILYTKTYLTPTTAGDETALQQKQRKCDQEKNSDGLHLVLARLRIVENIVLAMNQMLRTEVFRRRSCSFLPQRVLSHSGTNAF